MFRWFRCWIGKHELIYKVGPNGRLYLKCLWCRHRTKGIFTGVKSA